MGKPRWALMCLALGACQMAAAPEERTHARSEPNARSCKPEAPVVVEIESRELSSHELEVTARVVPTAFAPSLDVRFALPPHAHASTPTHARFGATSAGATREITARVRLADRRSSSITAIVDVPVDGVAMSRTANIAVGLPVPVTPTLSYALPDGELAREVRP